MIGRSHPLLLLLALITALVLWAGVCEGASHHLRPAYVSARYSGSWDESFGYQPSDPTDWQQTTHLTWDEQVTAEVGRPYPVSVHVLNRSLNISGTKTSSYANNPSANCSAMFSVKAGHAWPLTILSGPAAKPSQLHLNVSANAPLDLTQFVATDGTGDCATIRTPVSPSSSRWQQALTPLADLLSTQRRYERRFDTTDGSLGEGGQITVHATLLVTATSAPTKKAGCAARICAVCPNPPDDAVRAAFQHALSDTGAQVDQLPKLSGFHAARVKLLAAVNAARPSSEEAQLAALAEHQHDYESRIRKVDDRQASKLRSDERRWLHRARCPDTREAIRQGFQAPRENLQSSYRRAQSYIEYLTHAIKARCGCGGVKHQLLALPLGESRRRGP